MSESGRHIDAASHGQCSDDTCDAHTCDETATTRLKGENSGGFAEVCDSHATSYTAGNWRRVEDDQGEA